MNTLLVSHYWMAGVCTHLHLVFGLNEAKCSFSFSVELDSLSVYFYCTNIVCNIEFLKDFQIKYSSLSITTGGLYEVYRVAWGPLPGGGRVAGVGGRPPQILEEIFQYIPPPPQILAGFVVKWFNYIIKFLELRE